ncbi:unnamed protein product [Macrosiphum euphorbiae]|uniref:Uncharacterized protein n=1 Tax=Macrosiphum euphorbiae TaxID=13131 RepID=A0AAV0W0L2_9HEMI|nr:unnamed protein product [Macrosiphum euphorbiae]
MSQYRDKVRRDKANPSPIAHAYNKIETSFISYQDYIDIHLKGRHHCVAAEKYSFSVTLPDSGHRRNAVSDQVYNVPSHGVEQLNRPGLSPGGPREDNHATTLGTTTAAATRPTWW